MTFVSFAQNFEDVMLHRALGHISQGFYVDIGAQHPMEDSVTKAFSLAGWRGVNIEPVKQWYDLLVADRPYDINLNVAVGEPGELRLFEVEGTGLSTTDAELADRYRTDGKNILEHVVPAVSLDSIFEDTRVGDVHFLKVDCEGAERVALASCSFDRVRPWVVVVEATEPNSQVGNQDKWEDILLERQYVPAYYDGLNRYYVAKEHGELLASFAAPPNVFDDFIRARDKNAHDALSDLHYRARDMVEELTSLRPTVAQLANSLDITHREHGERLAVAANQLAQAESELAVLRAELSTRRADADRSSQRITELEQLVGDLRAQMEAERLVSERRALEHKLAELRASEASLRAEVSRLNIHIHAMVHSTSWRLTAPVRSGKLFASRLIRGSWNRVRPFVATTARAARPAMSAALRIPGVKPVVGRVLAPHSRLGRRARRFLSVPPPPAGDAFVQQGPLTEHAQAMEALLRDAIARRSQEKKL